MKVDFYQSASTHAVSSKTAQSVTFSGAPVSSSTAGDRTTLSTSGPSLASMVSEVMKAPSVRQDKVNALREAVSSGTYQIDSHKIASSLINESD